MRILWFSNTPSLYDQGKHLYHGGGWIEALEELIKLQPNVELGVSFFHKSDNLSVKRGNTTYFPLKTKRIKKRPLKTIINNWRGVAETDKYNTQLINVIDDFKPDLIQIFGTEGMFSQIQELTSIPVVIHIQGIINPYYNAYFPVNQSKFNFLFNPSYLIKNILGISPVFNHRRFRVQAEREKQFLVNAQYVMGRTHWDKMIAKLYNPNVEYFHIDEVLRDVFYDKSLNLSKSQDGRFNIISTLSPTIYKGIDVVLKTAKLLKELTDLDFEWQIIGLSSSSDLLKHFEKSESIQHKDVNIICKGRKSPNEMIELMTKSNIFVHPSYIDNSPNSICEAQLLGLPVIACNVGGVASLIKDGETGILIPSNSVFELTSEILNCSKQPEKLALISENAKKVARLRHNKKRVMADLMEAYNTIKN